MTYAVLSDIYSHSLEGATKTKQLPVSLQVHFFTAC